MNEQNARLPSGLVWVAGVAVAAAAAWAVVGRASAAPARIPSPQGPPQAPQGPSAQPAKSAQPEAAPPAPNRRLTVARGESWSSISQRVYGDATVWPALWDANRRSLPGLDNPEKLALGTVVEMPELPRSAAFLAAIRTRAEDYRRWFQAGRQGTIPASVLRATPTPV